MVAGVAATTALSWIYATTTWAETVTTSGAEVIEEAAEVAKQLVTRASWVGERTMSAYGNFLERMIEQTGDAACLLIAIVTAVIAETLVYE